MTLHDVNGIYYHTGRARRTFWSTYINSHHRQQTKSVNSHPAMRTALCVASLSSQKWQRLVAMAAWRWIYDKQDRCELGLSICWQYWWQDRRTHSGVFCTHPSAAPPPLSAPDREDTGSRVFMTGRWQWHDSSHAVGKCVFWLFFSLQFVSVCLRAVCTWHVHRGWLRGL